VTEQTALAVSYPETVAELFAPVDPTSFADLVREHDAELARMNWLSSMVAQESTEDGCDILRYFARGNGIDGAEGIARHLFTPGKPQKALAAAYWGRAMDLTDVYETMPADDKIAWTALLQRFEDKETAYKEYGLSGQPRAIVEPAVPDFTVENIQATFSALLADRHRFFAKRVDGVFRALSPNHKTNRPQGFRSKLVMANVLGGWHSWEKIEYLRDLRRVIGTFMGRGELDHSSTEAVCKWAQSYHRGEWVWLDGNSWAIRCYNNGNVHVKLHDEMVYRLNMVLAMLYPASLSAEALARPKRKPREVQLEVDVVDFATLARLRDVSIHKHDGKYAKGRHVGGYRLYVRDAENAGPDLARVLRHLGGVCDSKSQAFWNFAYHPGELIAEIVARGVVPGVKSHQFYPTPLTVAERVVALAELYKGCRVLEPSAGAGGIVEAVVETGLPEHVTCVEVAELHAKVLARSFQDAEVVVGDFLTKTAADLGGEFDRVVMNPPFAGGRAAAHIEHAAGLLREGGRLVAVAPISCRDLTIPGFSVQVADEVCNAFEDTTVDVLLLVLERL